jgi:ribonucleoside-diphosphate reductase alpha chain
MDPMSTFVVKQNGEKEQVSFDKILTRINSQSGDLGGVDSLHVAKAVVQGLYDGVSTKVLDNLASEISASLSAKHPDYSLLAARIAITRLQKSTTASIMAVKTHLAEDVLQFVMQNQKKLDEAIDWERDVTSFDFFGFKTLERAYLLKNEEGEVIERPQVMYMRVSLGIHCGNVEDVIETYKMMSEKKFIHATPTMFNAGTRFPNLASCFLLPIDDDSIQGIFETNKKCALISKNAGGIGFSVSNVRCTGSKINSSGGKSAGLVPMLRCFDATAKYVDQGGGKRKGAFAAYLEPWHGDVKSFLDLKKNHGVEEMRARDLFYALWIPDIFMRRVESNSKWTLFCPSQAPDLHDAVGEKFDALYEEYERNGTPSVDVINAQDLWFAILNSQIETGTPYLLYKDASNLKSNHKHLGTIRSSNLCTEIIQSSAPSATAVCNLASISLPAFAISEFEAGDYDFDSLSKTTRVLVRNLNKVIDRSHYPSPEARNSNMKHRPIGIGVQGLADVFALLNIPFESKEASDLNKSIFETIYYSALDESCNIAKEMGKTYDSYQGSPISKGLLQPDLWGTLLLQKGMGGKHDWDQLRGKIRTHGVYNSLLTAPMPTASTSQILGNNECFEPFTSNAFVRSTLAGEFCVINKHLVRSLEKEGLWNEHVRQDIISNDGSIQSLSFIPKKTRDVFKTAFEMSMKSVIDLSAERAPFVDQSQSLNLFVLSPSHQRLSSMHFYAWKKRLKTGMYYLRTKAAKDAIKVTIPAGFKSSTSDCESCSA